ncbi:MAG: class I tRNA ligase family protein [Candidatus Paceibacterota bacterium]
MRVRLNETIIEMTKALDAYELEKACRPIESFVDDLSTWYLRRSRERVKSEDTAVRDQALASIRSVVRDFTVILAPFMPFLAEEVFQKMRFGGDVESVHLELWPSVRYLTKEDSKLISRMSSVREIVSLGLEARSSAGVKVRQPLASISLTDDYISADVALKTLIIDEVNVKDILVNGKQDKAVVLDTVITSELKEEGQMRELVRAIQEARKEAKFMPSDKVILILDTDQIGKTIVKKFEKEIARVAGIVQVKFETLEGSRIDANGVMFGIKVQK